jgi:hypothetical protein
MNQIGKNVRQSILWMLCIMVPLFAQKLSGNDSKPADQKQRTASAIFDDIMLTLPGDMKAKVDSAASNRKCVRPSSASSVRASGDSRASNKAAASRENAVGTLPEEVRSQVEKAIIDNDLMNQNRQVQFKEYEKKHPGTR